ncbi:hypothetical protein TWF281_011681 [Arthrobotrys megalospora]
MPTPLSQQGNDEFWKTATSSYDSLDWQKKLTSQIRAFIQRQADWLALSSPPATDIKLLDYACGPGVVSLAQTSPPSLIRAEEADLFLPDPKDTPAKFNEEEDYKNFDYAFCSAALHHVDSPSLGVQRLADRVKSNGGRVVIIEFLARDLNALKEGECC